MAIGGNERTASPDTLKPGEWTLRDEEVQEYIRTATREVESLVRSTFGPLGMEKLVWTQDHQGRPEIVQTSDASEILAALERGDGFTHPIAALFIDQIDSMQRGLNDGTTRAIILTAALIDQGLELIESGLSPANIIIGYAMAANRAGTVLDDLAREITIDDTDRLRQVAVSSMTALDLTDTLRNEYAEMVVEAVQGVDEAAEDAWLETDNIKVLGRTGVDHTLHRGLVVRRWPGPADESEDTRIEFDSELAFRERTEEVGIAMIEGEIAFGEPATHLFEQGHKGTRLSPDGVRDYAESKARMAAESADQLIDLGVDVVVTQERLEDPIKSQFEGKGLVVIDRAKYPLSDIYRLAQATNGTVESTVDDVTAESVGVAGSVIEKWVGEERWTIFDDCEPGVFTVVIDAVTEVAATERERLVKDAIEITAIAAMDQQILPGAGSAPIAVASDLRDYAPSIADRSQLAVEAFADAIEEVPRSLIMNAGRDPVEVLTQLRAQPSSDLSAQAPMGFDAVDGDLIDPWSEGIIEPRRIFSQAIETARTAAEQLVTIDAVLFPNVDFEAYEPVTEHD